MIISLTLEGFRGQYVGNLTARKILPPLVFLGVEAFLSSGIGLHLLRSGVLFQIEHLKHVIINIVKLQIH